MAWRFKASKYKNAAPIVPKAEACVREICVGSYQTYGNNIAASAAFMAFNWEHSGSSVAVLPLDDCGRKSKTMPLLHGHTDTVTDLKFSPFHDGLLATASQDCLVSEHSRREVQLRHHSFHIFICRSNFGTYPKKDSNNRSLIRRLYSHISSGA